MGHTVNLHVVRGSADSLRVVAEETERDVTVATEEAAHGERLVAVIYRPLRPPAARLRRLADSAAAPLAREQILIRFFR